MKRSVCLSAVVAVLLMGTGRVVGINGGWKEARYTTWTPAVWSTGSF